MGKDRWVWMPHPAHFICAFDCRFHLATYVGKYIVSTVGELFPDAGVREINASLAGIELQGKGDERKRDYIKRIGYETIGHDRKYETMVFKAAKRFAKGPDHDCCLWEIKSGENIDMLGYNTPAEAYAGHMRLCKKWSKHGQH